MLLLLSPAKKQDFGFDYQGKTSQCRFVSETIGLVECLRQYDVAGLQKLMGISHSLAELNLDRYRSFCPDYSGALTRPAVMVFQGDVYQGLQAQSLTSEQRIYMQKHLRILSGLYGVLRPLDLIQPYRLEMKTKMITPKGEGLVAFWGPKIAQAIADDFAKHASKMVVNLASKEYFKAVDLAALGDTPILTIDFKVDKGDGPKIIGVYAKKARGMMARYVIEHGLTEPEGMQAFNEEGYRYMPSLSKDNHWVFVKKIKA